MRRKKSKKKDGEVKRCARGFDGYPPFHLRVQHFVKMTDLTLQYKSARSLILKLREGLEKLEKADQRGDQMESSRLSSDLQAKLTDLQRISTEMDSVYRMQALSANSANTSIWKRKIEQVTEEEYHVRQALDARVRKQHRRQVEDAERQELLQRDVEGRAWQSSLDADARSQSHVRNSRRMVEDMLQNGATILVDMSGQRDRLKSAHRKMLDALNSAGLSDSLLRVIERRQLLDRVLVYGGMAFVVLFFFLILWWRRS